jgi:hypothetical protein
MILSALKQMSLTGKHTHTLDFVQTSKSFFMATFRYTLQNLENAHNGIYDSNKFIYRKIWGQTEILGLYCK